MPCDCRLCTDPNRSVFDGDPHGAEAAMCGGGAFARELPSPFSGPTRKRRKVSKKLETTAMLMGLIHALGVRGLKKQAEFAAKIMMFVDPKTSDLAQDALTTSAALFEKHGKVVD
jgi:hypothetical protein